MSLNNDFLNAFKCLENAVRDAGYESVLDYETALDKIPEKKGTASKLRFLRQCRNFMVHENAVFFEAGKEMVQFLKEEARRLSSAELPVKECACRKLVMDSMKLQDAVAVLKKRPCIRTAPVFDKNKKLVGYLGVDEIYSYLSKNNVSSVTKVKNVMSNKNLGKIFVTIQSDVSFREIQESNHYIVINSKDEPIGWY